MAAKSVSDRSSDSNVDLSEYNCVVGTCCSGFDANLEHFEIHVFVGALLCLELHPRVTISGWDNATSVREVL